MKVLVTGSTGFVGRHLVARLLQKNQSVHVVLRQDGRQTVSDRATPHVWDHSTEGLIAIMQAVQPDVVCHVASFFVAEHKAAQVEALIQSNVLFGTQLLEAMAAAKVQNLVNFGTSWQHYHNQPYSPVCLYAATKQAFEAIIQFYVESAGLKVITLKLFDTYGPNDDRGKLFATLMKCAKTGAGLDLSPGDQHVDFVYIDDVVDAVECSIARLLDQKVSGVESYGVSSGTPLSLRQFVEKVGSGIGSPLAIAWGARPYRAREVMALWSDYAPVPGWHPSVSLDEGIRRTVAQNV